MEPLEQQPMELHTCIHTNADYTFDLCCMHGRYAPARALAGRARGAPLEAGVCLHGTARLQQMQQQPSQSPTHVVTFVTLSISRNTKEKAPATADVRRRNDLASTHARTHASPDRSVGNGPGWLARMGASRCIRWRPCLPACRRRHATRQEDQSGLPIPSCPVVDRLHLPFSSPVPACPNASISTLFFGFSN